MVQFYLLSIILNGVIGFLLIFEDKLGGDSTAKNFNLSWGIRLVLGIISVITGILKLLLPMTADGKTTIYILGDLLPAVAGVAAGFILIFGFYRENSTRHDDYDGKLDRVGDTLLHYKKVVGVSILAVAVLHFLLPYALFL